MIKQTILSITVGSLSLMAPSVFAQTTSAGSAGSTGGSSYITPSGGGNAADSGRSAQTTQLMGAAVGIGAAAMYSGVCATVYGSWACPLAAMAGIAASMLGGASKGSGAAGSAMSAYDPSAYNYGSTAPVVDQWGNVVTTGGSGANGSGTNLQTTGTGGKLPDGTTSQTIARDVARLQGDLARSGAIISADGKTMTTKDGRKFDLSKGADGSMEGLMGMGLSAGEAQKAIDAGNKYSAAANAKYSAMIAKMGADGGGGGGSAGRGPADDGSGGAGRNGFAWGDPRNKARAKANLAGLTRKLGDDTIGVAGDDIFEMVTRRYKARDQNGNFLKD
ncbi:hypothetical protein BH10BDE1_BH10BDE1_29680 [soil metagenome]